MKGTISALCSVRAKVAPHARRAAVCLIGVAIFALAFGVGRGEAFAESRADFSIIVHPGNPVTDVSRSFLADVYLKRTTRWGDGELARPIDQRADSGVRRAFSESVLKRSVEAVKRYWQQRIFSGRELPPPELDGDDAVVTYVANHRGAIGYVSGNAKLEKTKLVPVR
jgi:hypothetical protein